MEMHQVRYFLAVCETLSFTRAAELCHVSQPSLTQAIKKLEEELGGALFVRQRNRVRLTELGLLTRPQLAQVHLGSQTALANAQHFLKLSKAPLRLGVMLTVGPLRLAPFLSHFQAEHPGVEVELHEGKEDALLQRLRAGELHAVVTAPLEPLGEPYRCEAIYTEGYVVVFPPGHRFEGLETVRLKDVHREPYLDRLSCELRDMVIATCLEREVELYAHYRSEREDWIQGMVMARLGVAFMPRFSIVVDGIGTRPLVEPRVLRSVQLVTLCDAPPSHAADALLDQAQRWPWQEDDSAPEHEAPPRSPGRRRRPPRRTPSPRRPVAPRRVPRGRRAPS